MISKCNNCNKEFSYKWHGRGHSCSPKCTVAIIAKSKIKYSDDQIAKVIALKKAGYKTSEIIKETNVKISKVKEIVKKNKLFVTKEEIQKRAYESKISKDPNAMAKMRNTYRNKTLSSETLEEIKQTLLTCGYEYVEGFNGKSKPFTIKCLKCQKNRQTSKINTVVKDTCSFCSGIFKISAAEIEIKEWLECLGVKVERYQFAEKAGGLEIDVYSPELNIGIEYCGLYWHNENSPTPRANNYHLGKMKKANRDGIRLITIFEDEWRDRKDQVKGFLSSVFGKNKDREFARKLDLKEVSFKEASSFLKKYHIQGQGSNRREISFGLYKDQQLLGLITGSTHHRKASGDVLVLNRMAFKSGTTVVGGASRLFKALKGYAKKEGYGQIVSWSDNRWSEGNVYKKMGFTLKEDLKPDYSYVDGPNRLSKQSCNKKKLINKGAVGDTELEMASSLGLKRIWDCGKKTWAINL